MGRALDNKILPTTSDTFIYSTRRLVATCSCTKSPPHHLLLPPVKLSHLPEPPLLTYFTDTTCFPAAPRGPPRASLPLMNLQDQMAVLLGLPLLPRQRVLDGRFVELEQRCRAGREWEHQIQSQARSTRRAVAMATGGDSRRAGGRTSGREEGG